jgi:Ca-activated chloride channel family protein
MTLRIVPLSETAAPRTVAPRDQNPFDESDGLGCLRTDVGNLPLERIDAAVAITGLLGRTVLTQGFRNPHPTVVEATYIFPLPDRAAVTAMTMTADDRVVRAELNERGEARQAYEQALSQGMRAAIAEQERADVFTMRVGNILPGERVTVELTVVGPLPYSDGEATYRLPLVVAPRYIPGTPLPGEAVGAGYADDTDAVPDASRITPPVLLSGFPNPIALSIAVDLDPAGLPLGDVRSSLHAVQREGSRITIEPGERVNRDFILRLAYGTPDQAAHTLALCPDGFEDRNGEGTFRLTILPPTAAAPPRPRDVVLLLDRSGSMQGWKMVAARRAAARIVDTLGTADRFAVLTFDHQVAHPEDLGAGLVVATDRHRFRAVRHLACIDARGGTELLAPLSRAISMLPAAEGRDRVVVLVTDGQVGNEDQIIASTRGSLAGIRVHTVGIDQAVNAGFLGRLAAVGGGRCELVESEDRLDEAMDRIHRRIAAPVVSGLTLAPEGLDVIAGTVTPARLPDLFPGAPIVVSGRYRTSAATADTKATKATVMGRTRDGEVWSARVVATGVTDPAVTTTWARAHLGDLEDHFAAQPSDAADLERRIVATSLRFGVLCRFTAWLAVDNRVVSEGGEVHRIVQPVEQPAGWEMDHLGGPPPAPLMAMRAMAAPTMAMPSPGRPPSAAASAPRRRSFMPARAKRSETIASEPSFELAAAQTAPAAARPEGPGGTALTAGLGQIADEIGRLHAGAELSELDRRELLADLGTRLEALVQHLAAQGVPAGRLAELRALVARLDEATVLALPRDEFDQLWLDSLTVLTSFAGA